MGKRADEYRQKAVALCAIAKRQADFAVRVEYEHLAFHCMDLAEEVEKLGTRGRRRLAGQQKAARGSRARPFISAGWTMPSGA